MTEQNANGRSGTKVSRSNFKLFQLVDGDGTGNIDFGEIRQLVRRELSLSRAEVSGAQQFTCTAHYVATTDSRAELLIDEQWLCALFVRTHRATAD